MKKMLCVMLVALMLMGTAFAEKEFTLHNGTKFGMTLEEVRQLEQETIDGPLNAKWGITLKNYESNGYLLGMRAVIAGYDNTSLCYGFIDNKLVAMYYGFKTDANTIFDEYYNIEQGLVKKYGEAEYSSTNGLSLPTVQIYPTASFIDYITPGSDCLIPNHAIGNNVRDMYSHRILPIGEGTYILIDHSVLSTQYDNVPQRTYSHTLQYFYLTEHEAQVFFDEIADVNNDL